MKTPNIWDNEVNDEWGKYCPQEVRNTFTGEQLCWLKSFADKYAEMKVKNSVVLADISNQREQLISFFNWYEDNPKELSNNVTIVDAYLEEINCC